MSKRTANVLLLYAEAARFTATVDDHIKSIKQCSEFSVLALDSAIAPALKLDLSMFDAIVFHYSIQIWNRGFLSEAFSSQISSYRGLKVLFIQDEMRWVNKTSEFINNLGISVVFTVVNKDVVRQIYHHDWFDRVRFECTLTGFVPEYLIGQSVPTYGERELDVVYRARKLPAWCGTFGQEKWRIGERFQADAHEFGLNCDISWLEEDRIYGAEWVKFLSSAKATLGAESGSSFIDYSDRAREQIDDYLVQRPDATFETLSEKFLEGRDGKTVIHVISPRFFEAATLRTLMILYPGEYSGILEAGKHYLALERDHSNMAEVVKVLRDCEQVTEIVDRAYTEIACSEKWTFRTFVKHFDSVIEDELATARSKVSSTSITSAQAKPLSPLRIAMLEKKSKRRATIRHRRISIASKIVIEMKARTTRLTSLLLRLAVWILPSWARRLARRMLDEVKRRLRPILFG